MLNIPDGATHYDGLDYWKLDEGKWFIWIDTVGFWQRIVNHKPFHDEFGIHPI